MADWTWERLLVEPARPDAIRTRKGAEWLVVATVCIGAFMGQLDASIVTLAMPTLRGAFRASLESVEWVALTYLVVLVATVTAVGRLGDVVGRKLLYTYGFAVFTLATVGCGLAPSLTVLLVARAVQALGAAMLQANSVALIVTSLPRDRQARGLGIQGAAQALGLALGPTVGGLLISAGGWRWVFFATVPAGVIGTVAGWYLLPRTRDKADREPFDALGLAVFAPTVLALLAGLAYDRWWLAAVPAGVVALITVERRATAPLLPAALVHDRRLASSIVAGLLAYLALFGILFAAPFYCADALHLSAVKTGALLTLLPAAIGVTAPLAGAWADRHGSRPPAIAGMLMVCCALAIGITRPHVPLLALTLVLAGAGVGTFTPANNLAVMAAGRQRNAGQIGGLLNMTRALGTALGVAVTGLALAGQPVAAGFRDACWLLLALAAAAGALVAAGSRAPRTQQPPG